MTDRRLTIAAAAWLTVVVTLAVTRAATGWPDAIGWAASPDALERGRLWLLASSALVVDGPPVIQILVTTALALLIVRRIGAGLFWLVAVLGHVGATLAVYGGIAAIWVVDAHAVRQVTDAPDYGISAVSAACAGAVCAAGALGQPPRRRLALGLGVTCLLVFLVLVPVDGELADVEHLVAFVIGAAVAGVALHHGGGADRDALRPPRLPSLRRRPRATAGAAR